MTEETPKKRLTIKRKRPSVVDQAATEESTTTLTRRSRKRVLTFDKPQKKQPQPPPKPKKKVAPSVVRSSELNKVLSQYSKAWRSYRPLSHDIERQIFQYIGANHLSASKRVVKDLIKKQTSAINYLKNSTMDEPVYNLDDNQAGLVSWERANIASKLLVKIEAQRETEKRAKKMQREKNRKRPANVPKT